MKTGSVFADIKSLANKSIIYGLGNIVLRAINFFLLPVYTRFLTPTDYGILAVTGIVSSILGILLSLSLHSALNPIYYFTSDDEQRRADLGTVWLTLMLLAGGTTFILDRTGSYLFPIFFKNVLFVPYIRLVIWNGFLNTFSLVPLALFQMQERAKSYVTLQVAGVLSHIGLIIYYVVIRQQGVYGNLLGNLLGTLAMTVPYIWVALKNIQPTLQKEVLKRALAYSLPLVPHSLASWVLELSDRAILERFVPLDQLGLYALGYTYGAIMNLVAYAVNIAWVPFLFKTNAQEGDSARHRLARLGTYFALFLCFVALTLALFAQQVIEFMTAASFHAAASVTPWIVAGLLLSGLYYFPINFLFLKQKTTLIPVVTVLSGLLNIGLNVWLVPQFGIMAAAWSTFISYGAMLVFAWRLSLRVYAVPYEYMRLLKIGVVTITLWLIGSILPFTNLLGILIAKCLVVALFPLSLLALGFFTPIERQHAGLWLTSAWSTARTYLSSKPGN